MVTLLDQSIQFNVRKEHVANKLADKTLLSHQVFKMVPILTQNKTKTLNFTSFS